MKTSSMTAASFEKLSIENKILDGKKVADELLASVRREIEALNRENATLPKLAVILAGDDPASQVYVNKKAKVAHQLGMLSEVYTYGAQVHEEELRETIRRLNKDPNVHAILIQLPLPRHLNSLEILSLVDPKKDVDGFHPANLGKLLSGQLPDALPCTPAGIMTLLRAYGVTFEGKRAVIVGRSNIVGKPMGLLLLNENATVTYCHSKTRDLPSVTREADILIAAVGIPNLINADYVKDHAVVVDVGINRVDGKLVGDVDFNAVIGKAACVTPVPGGVGPMTIATLMSNTLALYKKHAVV